MTSQFSKASTTTTSGAGDGEEYRPVNGNKATTVFFEATVAGTLTIFRKNHAGSWKQLVVAGTSSWAAAANTEVQVSIPFPLTGNIRTHFAATTGDGDFKQEYVSA